MTNNNVWPGETLEKVQQQRNEVRDRLDVIEKTIDDHFGNALENEWFRYEGINDMLLLKIGPDVLTRFGRCECCTYSVGVSYEKRYLKNVTVLNSYCKQKLGVTKPLDSCLFWLPKIFYQLVILAHIERLLKDTPDLDWWMNRKEWMNGEAEYTF